MKRLLPLSFILALALFCQGVSLASEGRGRRIISLAPSTTEILFALGLDKEITGVTAFCNYPPEALAKEKVGTFSQPDIEKIIFLKPDIIFAAGLEQAPIVDKLRRIGLKIHVSDPSGMEELFGSIRHMAHLTGRGKEADLLIGRMRSRADAITRKVGRIPYRERPRVFVEIWSDPLMTAGRGSFVDELIGLAGGLNIAYDTPRPYSYFSHEQVIKRDPDCVILGYMSGSKTVSSVKNRLGWGNVKAVREGRIYNDINSDLFLRPGPRLIDGLEEIHNKLYGDK